MAHVKAIALPANPLVLAVESLQNFGHLVADTMYGTRERSNITCLFALLLGAMGSFMHNVIEPALAACPL